MSSPWRRTVPFAPFVILFAELGWTHQVVPGSNHLFTQRGSNFGLMLPLPKRGRLPSPYVMVVGRTLDELGEMERSTAEERLTPAATRPSPASHRRAARVAG